MRNLLLIAFVLFAVFFSWGTMHAQDATPEELLRSEVTAQVKSANFPRIDGYESYIIGDVRIEDDWGLFNVISSPISPTEESGYSPNILLGFAQWDSNSWHAYIEFTPSYYQNLHNLPPWLEWLRIREEGVHTASVQEVISVPALPFKFGEAWRYTQGPNLGHSPDNSVDFANWPRGVPGPVHAVEGGTVLAVGYTGTKELLPNNCLTVERSSDQLKVYYLHLNENDVNAFQIGDPIDVGQFLGYTSMSNGCGGGPTGLHIHIEFRKISNPYAKPSEGWHTMIGSSFNGWIIGGSELTADSGKTPFSKGAFTAYEDENAYTNDEKDITKRMRNRVGSSDPKCPINMLSGVNLYTGYKCDGRTVSITVPTDGTYLSVVGMNNALNSLSVAPGWHTVLYDIDQNQGNKTCFYGSITDLREYNYPGSSMKIAGTPSAIEVYDKGICPDGFLPPVKSLMCSASILNASSTSDVCVPRDITSPSASGYTVFLQNGSANLAAEGVNDTDSGVQRVQFSAKWNGEWHIVGSKTSAPYSLT